MSSTSSIRIASGHTGALVATYDPAHLTQGPGWGARRGAISRTRQAFALARARAAIDPQAETARLVKA